jgi:hypothetical protein
MKKHNPKYRILYSPAKVPSVWGVMFTPPRAPTPFLLQEKGWLFWNDVCRRESFEEAQRRMYQLIGEKKLAKEPPANFSAKGWRIRA